MAHQPATGRAQYRQSSGWSVRMGFGGAEERALAICCGLHERLGRNCVFLGIDEELVRIIAEFADGRDTFVLETEQPDPGCTLYGCMFDLRNSVRRKDVLISSITVFSSTTCPDVKYQIHYKHGSCWTHLHDPTPWIPVSCRVRPHSARDQDKPEHSRHADGACFKQTTLELLDAIPLSSGSVGSIYVHRCCSPAGLLSLSMPPSHLCGMHSHHAESMAIESVCNLTNNHTTHKP
eukprot:Tamp_24000.p1 GENE.Tamp_24000~~Tamp_24000.p1  ORF type:complete len:235 (+),score=16.40 Tamp_24000:118-822(+)